MVQGMIVTQLNRKISILMELEGSLSCSQKSIVKLRSLFLFKCLVLTYYNKFFISMFCEKKTNDTLLPDKVTNGVMCIFLLAKGKSELKKILFSV